MSAQQKSQSSEEDENVIVIPIDRSFSDGNSAVWPREKRFQMPDDRAYREKIATLWLKQMGAYEEGVSPPPLTEQNCCLLRLGLDCCEYILIHCRNDLPPGQSARWLCAF